MLRSLLLHQNRVLLVIYLLFGLSTLLLMVLNIHLLLVGRRYRRLMRGVDGANLEELLERALRSCQAVEGRLQELEELYGEIRRISQKAISRVGFLRFNAFPEVGSNLSFALALLDEAGDGVVLCCLVGRDDCRLYAKPVERGISSYPLSEEEKEAIRRALEKEG
ncbi:MAG: DUF4446 family protein [Thermacetogeniaceae bacterium]